MNKNLYQCHFCGTEDLPFSHRKKDKYTCNTCREVDEFQRDMSRATPNVKSGEVLQKKSNKVEKLSRAEISNKTIANMITDFGKAVLISNKIEPETKNILREVIRNLTESYLLVRNSPNRNDGSSAYYDTELEMVVYLRTLSQWE